jgi:hypothetical protein
MTSYFVNIRYGNSESLAAGYDSVNKTLLPVDSRLTIETGADFWALLLNDEYVMILDDAGLSVGDIKASSPGTALLFYQQTCVFQNLVAELNQEGILTVPDVLENETPSGFNLRDVVSFGANGMKVTALNEIWLLTDADRYVTSGGLLIQVR